MFTPKRILFLSVGIATLFTGASLARADATGASQSQGCVWYDCQFDGGGAGKDKNGGWEQHCKATGQFMREDGDLGVSNDNGNNLVLECSDGGDDGILHKVFDGEIKTRFDHNTDSLWLLGIGHDAPKIVIDFGDRGTGKFDEDHDRCHPADLAYTWDDTSYDIPGCCKLHKLEPIPSPSPTVTSPPSL